MSASVQTNISASYLSSFGRPIGVSVMAKTQSWPFLQQLGLAGSLNQQAGIFHGLSDFLNQMAKYSSTNALLRAAWTVIEKLVPNNPSVRAMLYTDPVLGSVGMAFQSLSTFGQVFALSLLELQQPSTVTAKVNALS